MLLDRNQREALLSSWMIQTFADKDTERLFNREPVKRFPPPVQRPALRKMRFWMVRNRGMTYEIL